jgi:hypothetical protein
MTSKTKKFTASTSAKARDLKAKANPIGGGMLCLGASGGGLTSAGDQIKSKFQNLGT